jgi:intein-encoded DNA endonuclease-like protein
VRTQSQNLGQRSYRPLSLRVRANERAKELRADGLSYSKIVETLQREIGFKASKGQLSDWLRGIHSPLGSANHFSPNPVPELAYVIGVELGDGSLNRKGYNRRIRLSAIDLEFVMEFDRCLAAVLETRRHKPWFDKKRGDFSIEARSVLLYEFLKRDWRALKPWIQHCSDCVAAFVRGFFDSEDSISKKGQLRCYNTDRPLLRYVKHLMTSFLQIQVTGPYRGVRAGSIINHRGRTYVRKSDCYSIHVRAASLNDFYQRVEITITRKRIRVERKLGLVRGG